MKKTIKNLIYSFIPPEKRYGFNENFWRERELIQQSKSWTKQAILDYQWQEFKKILNHSYKNTKYYPAKFAEYGINPDMIKDFNDIKKIPILTKDDVRNNLEDLIALPKNRLEYVTTGGSTGKPLGFYLEKNVTYQRTLAYEWDVFNSGGYKLGDKVAVLRGSRIQKISKIDIKNNYLLLSSFYLRKQNIDEYLESIKNFKPTFLRGYPSALEFLSKIIIDTKKTFNKDGKIKHAFTSSELLTNEQKHIIEDTLNLKIIDKYGNSEQCSILYQANDIYEDFKTYSFTEYLNDDELSSKEAQIISTSFVNYAMPFIRYKTNDLVYLENKNVSRIIGRRGDKEQYLSGKNGEKISLTALNTHSDIFDNAEVIQYYQNQVGHFTLIVIPKNSFNENDMKKIKKEFDGVLLPNIIEYKIEIKEKPILSESGKFKLLIKEV